MATATAPASASGRRLSASPASGRAGLAGAIRSEWTKIRTVRSTYFTLIAFIVVGVGFGALICYATENHLTHLGHGAPIGFDATQRSQIAFEKLGQLVMMVLGALVITSEYATGMIRPSLTAQPRRGTVYLAKGLVFTAIALLASFVTSFVTFFVGQQILKATGHSVTLSDPNVMRAVVGGALYVTLIGVISYALGAIIRHTAGTIATMAGVVFVLPLIVEVLPTNWVNDVTKWLPTSSGDLLITTVNPDTTLFSPWAQFAVTAGYTVILLIIGAVLLRKRDA